MLAVDSPKEQERFISILNSNKRILYKIIYAYCRDPEDRKDLEQEIIIQLWKSLKGYNETYRLSTWLYRVALNVAISFYRKDSNRRKYNTTIDDTIFQLTEDNDGAEELNNKSALLYKFINQLDEFSKAIIILHLEDNSYEEIAIILGISQTNVGTKISRIKRKLAEFFHA